MNSQNHHPERLCGSPSSSAITEVRPTLTPCGARLVLEEVGQLGDEVVWPFLGQVVTCAGKLDEPDVGGLPLGQVAA
jgi:hypothetical protein